MKTSKRNFLKGLSKSVGMAFALTAIATTVNLAQAQESRSYILATATTGGTYYPVGVALATLTKVKLEPKHKISLSAINSAGSGENIKLLRENEAQFAILMGLYGAWAINGEGALASQPPMKNLRSMTMLWQNVEQYSVRSEFVKTGTISDLAGLMDSKFAIGGKNSGAAGAARHIMANLDMGAEKFNLAYMGYSPSADALQNGTVSGINIPAGVPTGAMTRAYAALGNKMKTLDFTDEQITQANGKYNLWTRFVIPANTYPSQTTAVNTMAQPNFLAVRDDVSADDVYLMTKTMYENLPFLNSIHKATKAMALEKAIAGLPVPLHPGAARYYQEMGLTIPAHLIAQ